MLTSFFKRIIRSLGFDLRRFNPENSDAAQFKRMLLTHGVNLILDVGANVGQFGQSLRDLGFKGRIVSFEPLSEARSRLLKTSEADLMWDVAPQAAIGAEDGEIEIHIAGNSVSSSVLDMLDAHSTAAPDSVYVGSERVPLRQLDLLAMDYIRPESVVFLKIDTQGYEDKVLNGASHVLDRVVGLQLELSLLPLYDGQVLFKKMLERIESMGFDLWSLTSPIIDSTNGRFLQIDATFFKSNK